VTPTHPSSSYSWQNPSAPPPLDPQIAEFMRPMGAEGARYPKRHTIPIDGADPRVHSPGARLAGLPPACTVVTECDPLYDDNVLMAQALRKAGVAVADTLYPGTIHGRTPSSRPAGT
jgi:acetyl esterase/lipase